MIALPMHPSNAFTIEELNANLEDILHQCEQNVQQLVGRKDVKLDLCSKIENGRLRVDRGGHCRLRRRPVRQHPPTVNFILKGPYRRLRQIMPSAYTPEQPAHYDGAGAHGGHWSANGQRRNGAHGVLRPVLWCRRCARQRSVVHPAYPPATSPAGRVPSPVPASCPAWR